ncbi:MAG: NAD(P)(+) transhydrogenase (Re/Si-specific) subunit beta [Saprospiraceae bacterium]|nr:NAD(P)(+) transhydrogenase (Re/Si-specific) subunit beta [Saprospiraceae bacterium]MDW8484823.1 NAD(P)(+) transhydrogenase (Re/Si-specific) subunit beta [Saprospiraceae bacterium]
MEDTRTLLDLIYILSAITFILGFKLMSRPATARQGNLLSALGMAAAVVATLMFPEVVRYTYILAGLVIGAIIGALLAYRTPMTSMPQMVGLLNGFGGAASLLVAWAEFVARPEQPVYQGVIIWLTVLIGTVTLSGSLVAWAKLEERYIPTKPVLYPGQRIVSILVLAAILVGGIWFATDTAAPEAMHVLGVVTALAFALGILLVIPIGGADMPVVISLLNSYSGIAACASGFIIQNKLLIVAGALVGASGIILTLIMCKAMNRSVANVVLGGFGADTPGKAQNVAGEIKPIKPDEAYFILEAANSVVIVPGYGLAVSQAQHTVRELMEVMEKNGTEVRFAIHPVAGRMPGHMNVLLAEANIPYDALVEMDAINPTMDTVDVCMIIGANDVVNPAALEDRSSPLWGMPIIEAHRARTVIVMKRSMSKGFAGVENPLFFRPNTRMLFGDAKASLQALVSEFKNSN